MHNLTTRISYQIEQKPRLVRFNLALRVAIESNRNRAGTHNRATDSGALGTCGMPQRRMRAEEGRIQSANRQIVADCARRAGCTPLAARCIVA